MLASLTLIVVLAGVVGGVIVTGGDHHAAPRLVLAPGGRPPGKFDSSALAPVGLRPFHYRLAGSLADLGPDAAVARLEAPVVDDARVAAIAGALGVHGEVRHAAEGGGRTVTNGSAQLGIDPTPGGWTVSFSPSALDGGTGTVPPSGGSGTAGSADGSAPDIGSGVPPDKTVAPPDTAPGPTSTVPAPPVNLPNDVEAERIARALLEQMGVAGDWSVTIDTLNAADSVACSPEPCAVVPPEVLPTTRSVTLSPRFEGVAIDALSWQVQLGDGGRVESAWGTLTDLRTLGHYPLQSVPQVFADLAAGRGIDPQPIALNELAPGGAEPFHEIAPVDVVIDGVTLGYAVMPASDGGAAVVDIVPTYVFSGSTTNGDAVSRSLVAVEAGVTTPSTAPGPKPTDPGPTDLPLGKPEPQPMPVDPSPTVAGKPLP
jgi:hypothetical protein